MENCIFCKIVAKEIPSEIIYEDDNMIAFKDIEPAGPTHILFIPKKHIKSLDSVADEDKLLIGEMLIKIKKVAKDLGLNKEGYRVINNCGAFGGQTVDHLHFHLIGGRQMQWPPG